MAFSKFNKYEPLMHTIKNNYWAVDLFALEVGAQGYPSTSVLNCLKKLGFPNKLARSKSKILDHTSMTRSFYIWLARNTRSWDIKHMSLPTKPSSTNQASCQNSQSFSGTPQNIIPKEASITTASTYVGFFNKGNTCYANSTLQALSVYHPSILKSLLNMTKSYLCLEQ